jgi:predicted glycoside hydrolase/deacetylase ChbG (UPF0249 family)
MNQTLILNADDFGASHAHNSAVIQAFQAGSLTSASLMMGQPGTAEAITLAHATPGLPVGLHLALSDAAPVLSPGLIPDLVGADGRFYPTESAIRKASLTRTGRRQLRDEIHAQFEAFQATGLAMAHVNTHRHSHQIPAIALLVFAEARRHGVKISRVPWAVQSARLGDVARRLRFYALKALIGRFGVSTIYTSIGRAWDSASLLDALHHLPDGLVELYFHPIVGGNSELAALLDQRVLSRLRHLRAAGEANAHA